jgi:hypothetical protein
MRQVSAFFWGFVFILYGVFVHFPKTPNLLRGFQKKTQKIEKMHVKQSTKEVEGGEILSFCILFLRPFYRLFGRFSAYCMSSKTPHKYFLQPLSPCVLVPVSSLLLPAPFLSARPRTVSASDSSSFRDCAKPIAASNADTDSMCCPCTALCL